MGNNPQKINAVEISLAVVQELVRRDGARVTEIASEIDIAPSTSHKHLQTLLEEGYVIKEGDLYYPSMEYLHIGEYTRRRKPAYRKAEARVESLAEETGGRTHFVTEEHGRGRYVYTSTGNLAVETFTGKGTSFPLHVTASGKAILAHLPEERVHEIIDRHGIEASTEQSITSKESLFEELQTIRDSGVAFNIEEHYEGSSAVAAPVREPSGSILGALTISGPAQRLKGDFLHDELPDLLLATVNELELEIVYSD
ncbi:IclR family transcriptional regulator [Natronorubrum sp. FCH18a]|uniref:IclR family transcriptional regulator n=1 Tax=Natronorubrum sp. FCH18a TaxID=3447018 RepID=UPI003F517D6E